MRLRLGYYEKRIKTDEMSEILYGKSVAVTMTESFNAHDIYVMSKLYNIENVIKYFFILTNSDDIYDSKSTN